MVARSDLASSVRRLLGGAGLSSGHGDVHASNPLRWHVLAPIRILLCFGPVDAGWELAMVCIGRWRARGMVVVSDSGVRLGHGGLLIFGLNQPCAVLGGRQRCRPHAQ